MADIVEVRGLRELENTLKQLPVELRQKPLVDALYAAAEPVVAEARALVPKDTGNLAQKIKAFKARQTGHSAEVDIGVVGANRASRDEKGKKIRRGLGRSTYYWKFIEFGHLKRVSRGAQHLYNNLKKQQKAGKDLTDILGGQMVPARPFLRPALANKREAATQAFAVRLAQGIESIRSKLVKT